ncbi:MAG: hypothetical protein KF705_04150 [Phycisphaeraceae bacterium]|nr:hypothetical protein [Phycisphaeraceae bacterium]
MHRTTSILDRSKPIAASLALAALAGAASAAPQIINLRSGQVGGLPGLAGQQDDIVTFLPNNPPGAAISASPFTTTDFAGAASGPSASVINPVWAWTPGLTDPLARWINFDGFFTNPDGTPGVGWGAPGSCLYAVPFNISLSSITNATLSLEFAVDDYLGDHPFYGGGNQAGLYINGMSTGYDGGNFVSSTFHFQNITSFVNPGLNYLYFYQRDIGVSVSGLIFSARITVIPAPGAATLVGVGGLVAFRRRRH